MPHVSGRAARLDLAEALRVLARIESAWASNDPDAFAALFAETAKVVVGSRYLRSRAELRSYLWSAPAVPDAAVPDAAVPDAAVPDAAAAPDPSGPDPAGRCCAARVVGEPLYVACAGPDAALVVTHGAAVRPRGRGAPGPFPATWLLTRQRDGGWLVTACQCAALPPRG